jgi:hypothetical protein
VPTRLGNYHVVIRKTRPCTTVGNVFEECHVPYIFKTPLQISKMSRDIIAASKAKFVVPNQLSIIFQPVAVKGDDSF